MGADTLAELDHQHGVQQKREPLFSTFADTRTWANPADQLNHVDRKLDNMNANLVPPLSLLGSGCIVVKSAARLFSPEIGILSAHLSSNVFRMLRISIWMSSRDRFSYRPEGKRPGKPCNR